MQTDRRRLIGDVVVGKKKYSTNTEHQDKTYSFSLQGNRTNFKSIWVGNGWGVLALVLGVWGEIRGGRLD